MEVWIVVSFFCLTYFQTEEMAEHSTLRIDIHTLKETLNSIVEVVPFVMLFVSFSRLQNGVS